MEQRRMQPPRIGVPFPPPLFQVPREPPKHGMSEEGLKLVQSICVPSSPGTSSGELLRTT